MPSNRRFILKTSAIALASMSFGWSAFAQSNYPYTGNKNQQWSHIRTHAAQAFELKKQEKDLTGSEREQKRREAVNQFFQAAQWVTDYVDEHFRREQSRITRAFVFVCYSGALFFDNARQWDKAEVWYQQTRRYAEKLVERGVAVPDFNGTSISVLANSSVIKMRKLIEIVVGTSSSTNTSTTTTTTTTITAEFHGSNSFSSEFVDPLPDEYDPESETAQLLQQEEANQSPPGAIPW
jgi:hypothetical protein